MSDLELPPEYIRQAKLVAWQLMNGMSACHGAGVMHRDIKPANILWTFDDTMQIGDFGLARFVRGDSTHHDNVSLLLSQ